MVRSINEGKARRLALLAQIKQQRTQQGNEDGAQAGPRRIIGLSDSDDQYSLESEEEDEEQIGQGPSESTGASQQPVATVLLPLGTEGSNAPSDHHATSQPVKYHDSKDSNAVDDLSDQLATLGMSDSVAGKRGAAGVQPICGAPRPQGAPKIESTDGEKECDDIDDFGLDKDVARRLYPHQIVGIRWMWGLYKIPSGGEDCCSFCSL